MDGHHQTGVWASSGPKIEQEDGSKVLNRPVLFAQELLETFATHSSGDMQVPQGVQQGSGDRHHLTKLWADHLKAELVNLLRTLLNKDLDDFQTADANIVHNLDGGMWKVVPHQVTVRDTLHLLVTEISRNGASKSRAEKALANIANPTGRGWRRPHAS